MLTPSASEKVLMKTKKKFNSYEDIEIPHLIFYVKFAIITKLIWTPENRICIFCSP